MTATVTPTNREADRRIQPGEGKLKPFNHIVRIVVVPRSGSNAARESGGQGQSDDLTKDELTAAEAELKNKPASPSSGGTSGGQESSLKMFDVLEPYDIVAVGQKPASVRTVDDEGRPKPRGLDAHHHHHMDTVLRVWTESDTIEYQCDEEFEIVKVEKAGWKIYDAPNNPFGIGQASYKAQKRHANLWVWTSGLLPAAANNQQYKMTFKIKGELIDPDVVCGNPPPTP